MKKAEGKRKAGKGTSTEKRDELTRGLEYVRDLLANLLPAHGHMDALEAARGATNGLIEMRQVELSGGGTPAR